MQRYTIFFIAVNAATASVGELALQCTAAKNFHIYQILCVEFELLMMGEKTA
jgi:hypothetical protein